MANILLVGKYSVIEPLGLLFLAGGIKEEGHDVDIFLTTGNIGDGLVQKVYQGRYDFLGFSIYTGFHKQMFRKIEVFREDHKIIIGGPHTTCFARECLDHADFVVLGEGFVSIRTILSGLNRFKLVLTPYLVGEANIPFPDRTTFYRRFKSFHDNPIKNIICSMGCPFQCSYCFNDSYKKLYPQFKVRLRPVEHIIREAKELKQYPLELIYFQDDTFGFNINWLREFALKYRQEINIPYHCQIRPEMANKERLDLFKYSGCTGITMAIETANEGIRKGLLGRDMTDEQIKSAASLIKERGIRLRTEQMLGLPETSFEDEINLLKLNIDIKPDMAWTSVFAPYLGTSLGNYCKEKGLYDGNNDDLPDSFFENTKLNFDKDRKFRTNLLHKIFATCVKMEDGDKLAKSFIEKKEGTFDSWFYTFKQHLFDQLYKV